jgi:exonuclease SbcD
MRLIHVSDTHLGIFPRAYSKIDPSTGMRVRTEDFTNSFLFITEYAMRERVDIVLMCGDIFDRIDPVNKVRKDVLDSLTKLTQKGIRVVIIGGNHDTPRLPGSASPLQLLDHIGGVTVYHKPSPEPLTILADSGHDQVDIYPFPYLPPARWFDLKVKNELRVAEKELTMSDRAGIIINIISAVLKDIANVARSREHHRSILMLHYMIEGVDLGHTTQLINDIVLPKTVIPFRDFTYTACGHIHKFQKVNRSSDGGMAFYSGSTERTSFNEYDEEKGFILLDTERDDQFSVEFIKIPTRPMRLVEFRVPGERANVKNGRDQLTDFMNMLAQLRAKGEEKEAIIRILIRNATSEFKTNLNMGQDAIDATLKNAFHWDLEFQLREDEVHPSIKAGEVFLKPSDELVRYVEAMKKLSDEEKKRTLRLGKEILEEVLEKAGEEP